MVVSHFSLLSAKKVRTAVVVNFWKRCLHSHHCERAQYILTNKQQSALAALCGSQFGGNSTNCIHSPAKLYSLQGKAVFTHQSARLHSQMATRQTSRQLTNTERLVWREMCVSSAAIKKQSAWVTLRIFFNGWRTIFLCSAFSVWLQRSGQGGSWVATQQRRRGRKPLRWLFFCQNWEDIQHWQRCCWHSPVDVQSTTRGAWALWSGRLILRPAVLALDLVSEYYLAPDWS